MDIPTGFFCGWLYIEKYFKNNCLNIWAFVSVYRYLCYQSHRKINDMTTINFEEIKTQLVQQGKTYPELAEQATQKVVGVYGVWNRDGSARITRTCAGWICGSFPQTINMKIEVAETANFDEDVIKSDLQAKYPDAKIIVNII